jgi:vacuolar-type H+-ATPase subunit H
MKDDIIRQVREAEVRAEQKVQEAKTHADQVLRDARHQVVERREEILKNAKTQASSLFEAGAKGVEPEVARTKDSFQDDIANDTQCARKNIDAVIESVVTTFHEQIGSE